MGTDYLEDTAMETAKFDLFRLSCMLNDTDGTKLNSAIVSIVEDYIFQKKNESTLLAECFKQVAFLGIKVDFSTFRRIIEKASSLCIEPQSDDLLISLHSKEYDEHLNASANNLELFVNSFVQRKSLNPDISVRILDILHAVVYENIQSIAKGNMKALMADFAKEKFPLEEIEFFNEFIEEDLPQKDEAIYKTFYKAFQFALVTSGRAAQRYSDDLFKGKTYLLDSNVLFCLLGIDGAQKQDHMNELLLACLKQGVAFAYTLKSYSELVKRRDAAIDALERFNEQGHAQLAEQVVIGGKVEVKDGFANHYYICRRKNLASSPNDYRQKLMTDFTALRHRYKFIELKDEFAISAKDVDSLAKYLREEKKERGAYNYTGFAAKVDAYNVLLVRRERASNAFSFSDVKYFYLSTDNTLARILGDDSNEPISELILPAQAFLLHAVMTGSFKGGDFSHFVQFIKKSSAKGGFSGMQIMRYVSQISAQTTNPEIIADLLRNYSDIRYASTKSYDSDFRIPTFKEFTQTALDTQLAALAKDKEQAIDIGLQIAGENEVVNRNLQVEKQHRESAMQRSVGYHLRKSLNQAKAIELLILLVLVGLTVMAKYQINSELWWLILVAALAIKAFDILVSSRFSVMTNIWRALFFSRVKGSDHYISSQYSDEYLELASSCFKASAVNNLWSAKLPERNSTVSK